MAKMRELVRFFGLSILTLAVIAVAFFGFRAQIKAEIQENTFQELTEAAEREAAEIRRFFGTAFSRLELVARYDADESRHAVVDELFSGLTGGEGILWAAVADAQGAAELSTGVRMDVSGCDWFIRCKNGEQRVAAVAGLGENGEDMVLAAVPIPGEGETAGGVLFAAVDPDDISALTESNAFGGENYSLLTDSSGYIISTAGNTAAEAAGRNLFEYAGSGSLRGGLTVETLEQYFQNGETAVASFVRDGKLYYAADVPVGVGGWFVVLSVSDMVADLLSHDVLAYVTVMLILVVLVHTSVIVQAYQHEKNAVGVLEHEKELLRQSGERYELVNRLSNEVLFTIDMESGDILFNDNFETMFGFSPPQCSMDHTEGCCAMVDREDRPLFLRFMERMNGGAPEARQELRMVDARGVSRWKRLEVYSVFDNQGRVRQVVGKITDIHREKQSFQRLRKKADSDPLTGLLNRAAMERGVKAFLAGEGRDGMHAFLMIDVDDFKCVNDTLGHADGDKMLIGFASAVRKLFRAGDLVARMGGDEYAMFMKDIDSDRSALDKADEVRGAMAKIAVRLGVPVTASVGVSVYAQDGRTFESLYKAADAALYRMKNAGKNCCGLYGSACDIISRDTKETEDQDDGTTKD